MNDSLPDSHTMGRLQFIEELGHGGMARVHLAVLRGAAGFQKLVVVKVLRSDVALEEADASAMLLNEARLTGRMHHSNIAQTLEVGQVDDEIFLVMEYLEGQSLHSILKKVRQDPAGWSLAHHLRILTRVLAGLHYAHRLRDYDGSPLGIVHRDVSPQNVFVTYDGAVKIVDFGIAKASVSDVHTRLGVLKGKIAYMAPEHAAGAVVDRRADIFAVGVMLYEALSGASMWRGRTEVEIFRSLSLSRLPEIGHAAPLSPPRLREICAKALAPNPDDRYTTAGELQADLEDWIKEERCKTSSKQIGQVVSGLFGAERQRVRGAVDRWMRGAPSDPPSSLDGSSQSLIPSRSGVNQKLATSPPLPVATNLSVPLGAVARVSGRAALWACACLLTGFGIFLMVRRQTPEPGMSSSPRPALQVGVAVQNGPGVEPPARSSADRQTGCGVPITGEGGSADTTAPPAPSPPQRSAARPRPSRPRPLPAMRALVEERAEPERNSSPGQPPTNRPGDDPAPHLGDALTKEPPARSVRPIDTNNPFSP